MPRNLIPAELGAESRAELKQKSARIESAEVGAKIDVKFNTEFDATSDINVCKRISRPWVHTPKK